MAVQLVYTRKSLARYRTYWIPDRLCKRRRPETLDGINVVAAVRKVGISPGEMLCRMSGEPGERGDWRGNRGNRVMRAMQNRGDIQKEKAEGTRDKGDGSEKG